jgi:sterol desaturase/sphingolipid hydroxylase (fatty acid hydroxylase superfamily)
MPELHSVHHELDVHRYNFADLPIWDRMFGTYRDTDSFARACGFPNHNERHLGEMLLFRDVYNRGRNEADTTPRDTAPSRTG